MIYFSVFCRISKKAKLNLVISSLIFNFHCSTDTYQEDSHFHVTSPKNGLINSDKELDLIHNEVSKFKLNDSVLYLGFKIGMSKKQVYNHINALQLEGKIKNNASIDELNGKDSIPVYYTHIIIPLLGGYYKFDSKFNVNMMRFELKDSLLTGMDVAIGYNNLPNYETFNSGLNEECCDEYLKSINILKKGLIEFISKKQGSPLLKTSLFYSERYFWFSPQKEITCFFLPIYDLKEEYETYRLSNSKYISLALLQYRYIDKTHILEGPN